MVFVYLVVHKRQIVRKMADEEDQDSSETVDDKSDDEERPSARNARKYSWLSQALLKEENKARVKQVVINRFLQ